MDEFSQNPEETPKLERLCELALKQKEYSKRWYRGEYSEPVPDYFKQAAVTAFDLGRIDLFKEACKTTHDEIILDNAQMLGCWVAEKGIEIMKDRLLNCIRILFSVPRKVKFLKSVAEGFNSVITEPDSVERVILKKWSDEALLTAIGEVEMLTRADVVSLAQLCKTVEWSLFESKATAIILKAITVVKVAFINELLLILQPDLMEEQLSFINEVIRDIWKKFAFDSAQQITANDQADDLHENDIFKIVNTSVQFLSSECVETTIIPAMLRAIPKAPEKCVIVLFFSLVKMILQNEIIGFRLADNAVPPILHRRLVKALLTKFVMEIVGPEPEPPGNWSLPSSSCDCSDCSVVNRFLQDPRQISLDLRRKETVRSHLSKTFLGHTWGFDSEYQRPTYDVKIIRQGSPFTWQITKHRRNYERAKSQWMNTVKTTTETLSKFRKDEQVKRRLKAYLGSYYSIIMTANVKALPNLKSLVAIPQILGSSENTAPDQLISQTSHKRTGSMMNPWGSSLTKRSK